MRRIAAVSVLVVSWMSGPAARGEPTFEILRHEVDGGGTAQLFDGGPPVSDSISGDFPDDGVVGFSASDLTGIGVGHSLISVSGFSSFNNPPNGSDTLGVFSDLDGGYIGDGPNRPGGTTSGTWSSIIEFVMPVDRMEWEFIFTQTESSTFTQSSMVTVENVTAGDMLVSTTEPFGFVTELSGSVGDVLRVTAAYAVDGFAPPGASGLLNSNARLRSSFTIPEPNALWILSFGIALCVSARRRGIR